jgi:quercetin dioxygenase-like cupin family protein
MRRMMLVIFFGLALAVPATMAQDPVKVDPRHYKVEVDNSQVRVLRVKYGPGEKSVMHSHPFGVVVFLTDAHIRFHLPGGKSEVRDGKAGTAQMTPEETHLPENLGAKAFEAILIEIKGVEAPFPELKDDPLNLDPKHYVSEADVSQNASEDTFVRVLHVKYGPHEKSVMHSHPDAVAVFLTESHFKFTLADGKSEVRDGKAGDVRFTPAETHLPENTGDKTAQVILVELKTKPAR